MQEISLLCGDTQVVSDTALQVVQQHMCNALNDVMMELRHMAAADELDGVPWRWLWHDYAAYVQENIRHKVLAKYLALRERKQQKSVVNPA